MTDPAEGIVGGTVTLLATFTSNGSPVAGATINLTLNGDPVGSAITDPSGVASLTVSLGGINVGTYPFGVGASFAGGGGHPATSADAQLKVDPPTVPPPPAPGPFNPIGPIGGCGARSAEVAVAPSRLIFDPLPVGAVSAQQTVTVTNNGASSAQVASVAINSDSFAETDNCVGTLLPHASCTVQVVFAPTAKGEATGTLQLVDDSQQNEVTHPQAVALTGTGTAGSGITAAPAAISFAVQPPGTVSAARQVQVTNNLGSIAHITNVAVSGDFAATNNCSGPLNPGQSCTISVEFTPNASGAFSGTVTITSDSTHAPVTVALGGFATIGATPVPCATPTPRPTAPPDPTRSPAPTSAPTHKPAATPAPTPRLTPKPTATPVPTPSPADAALAVTPHHVSMGSEAVGQSAQTVKTKRVVLSNPKNNKQDATITIESITASGDFTIVARSCLGPLAPGHKCAVSVGFAPSSSGPKSGMLTITSNASNGTQTVTLEGKGRESKSASE